MAAQRPSISVARALETPHSLRQLSANAAIARPGLFFPLCQIAQFDCSVCTSEEADEAGTYRDDPRRIDIGHSPDVDKPSLQHSTASCTAKPKDDPKNKDERDLQGFFHSRSKGPTRPTR